MCPLRCTAELRHLRPPGGLAPATRDRGRPLIHRRPGESWPYQGLRVPAGWRPKPLREFVLKVHQRCNLACDYCYVYESPDRSWRDRPAVMSRAVWQAAAARIAEHAGRHGLAEVRVVLHGGEPLLAGADRLDRLITDLRAVLPGADVRMQTNGVLLDEPMLAMLTAHRVGIGVSLDGPAADHDRRRRSRAGTGSYPAVERALTLLRSAAYRSSYAGLLCTVDPATDPIAAYQTLCSFEPPAVDLLLPHATWAAPPAPGHADWLIAVFDRWYREQPPRPSVRLFEDVISLVLGGPARSDQVGLSPVAVAVVESDGTIEQVDSLKTAYHGAAATGLNVFADSFDAALAHPGVVARQIGRAALADGCLACPVHTVCGAGHYAHRYRPGAGFRNPSVYCADLRRLIDHVGRRVTTDLRERAAAAS